MLDSPPPQSGGNHLRRARALPIWPFPTLLALFLLLGLSKELWYDEAYTLFFYVAKGVRYSLTHYEVPNNHILFSALLAMLPFGTVEPVYRLASALAAMGAALFIILAVRESRPSSTRRARIVVVLGSLLAFPAFLTLSTQIRGYSLSLMLLAASTYALLAVHRGAQRWPTVLYAVSGAVSLATLPTSLLPLAALGLADCWLTLRCRPKNADIARLAARQLGGLVGLVAIVPVWREVVVNTHRGWAWQTPVAWLTDLGLALILPLLLIPSAWVARRVASARARPIARAPVPSRGVLGICSGVIILILAALGVHLFPRSFTGFIPLAVVELAGIVLDIVGWAPRAVWTVSLLVAVAGQVYWYTSTHWLLREAHPILPRRLLPPYYEAVDFDPAETVAAVARVVEGLHDYRILVDNRDAYSDEVSIWYYAWLSNLEGSVVFAPRNHSLPTFGHRRSLVLLVSRDLAGRDGLLAFLGQPEASCRSIKTSGYFKVWELPRPL